MSMIERVARAIAEANMEDFDETPFLHEAMAIAAIEAMGEPTEEMIEAAYDAHDRFEAAAEGAWCGLSSAYRAMIHAALNEKPGSGFNAQEPGTKWIPDEMSWQATVQKTINEKPEG